MTNAGTLLADDFPIHQSRIFCTRWNGLTMTSGLGEALDDAELEGSVIGQLQDAVAFMRTIRTSAGGKNPTTAKNFRTIPKEP